MAILQKSRSVGEDVIAPNPYRLWRGERPREPLRLLPTAREDARPTMEARTCLVKP
jgi:hypothetical protein